MSDPTELVITTAFCTAAGLFAFTAAARKLLGTPPAVFPNHSLALPAPEEIQSISLEAHALADLPDAGSSPYATPHVLDMIAISPDTSQTRPLYRPLDLLGIGFVFLVFFGLVIASVRAGPGRVKDMAVAELVASIGFQFVTAGIVIAFVIFRIRPAKWLGLRWPKWPWVFLIAPGAVATIWVLMGSLQYAGYMDWIQSFGVETVQDTVQLLQKSNNPTLIALMAIAAVIAAPICEEIVFRGYLYTAARHFAGPWVGGICSALIFGAAHGSLAALLPLTLFGGLLNLIYEKTRSIWATMAIHFCFNGATVFIQFAARYYHLPIDPNS